MENFFYEDRFCSDIDDLCSELEIDESNVHDLPDDWAIKVGDTTSEKMFSLTKGFISSWLSERVRDQYEERYPEESDSVDGRITKAIEAGIDIDKINEAIPSLWYLNGQEFTITKADLIEWCAPNNSSPCP